MEREELIRRLEDLSRRRDRSGCMTHSRFLTEEEQALTLQWGAGREGAPVLFGGREGCERRMAFFLTEWEQEGEALMAEEIACVALRGDLGRLTHRDYLGAVLALGLTRDALGDILPGEKTAYIFCTPAAAGAMERALDKVGRQNVQAEPVAPEEAPAPTHEVEETAFTVKSLRLDAVTAGLFHIARPLAVERIARGDCQLNHRINLKPDAAVKEGDVLSVRGLGKGEILKVGGQSKKGRLFITGGRWK